MKILTEMYMSALKFSYNTHQLCTTFCQTEGDKLEALADFIFLGSKTNADDDCTTKLKDLAPWKKSYDKPRQHIKKQRHHFANKDLYSQKLCFFQGSCTDVEKAMAPHSSTLAWKNPMD